MERFRQRGALAAVTGRRVRPGQLRHLAGDEEGEIAVYMLLLHEMSREEADEMLREGGVEATWTTPDPRVILFTYGTIAHLGSRVRAHLNRINGGIKDNVFALYVRAVVNPGEQPWLCADSKLFLEAFVRAVLNAMKGVWPASTSRGLEGLVFDGKVYKLRPSHLQQGADHTALRDFAEAFARAYDDNGLGALLGVQLEVCSGVDGTVLATTKADAPAETRRKVWATVPDGVPRPATAALLVKAVDMMIKAMQGRSLDDRIMVLRAVVTLAIGTHDNGNGDIFNALKTIGKREEKRIRDEKRAAREEEGGHAPPPAAGEKKRKKKKKKKAAPPPEKGADGAAPATVSTAEALARARAIMERRAQAEQRRKARQEEREEKERRQNAGERIKRKKTN